MMAPRASTTTTRTAVSFQLMMLSKAMLESTAMPGGMVFQVSELSMVQAAVAATVMRPARAPGKLFDEITRAVTGQMVEQLQPDVAADHHEGIGGNPAGQAPQQVVAGHQAEQQTHLAP